MAYQKVARQTHTKGFDSGVDLLESRGPMDRGSRIDQRPVCQGGRQRSNCVLGAANENQTTQPVSVIHVHNDSGSRDSRDSSTRQAYDCRAAHKRHDSTGDGSPNTQDSGPEIRNTFHQARSGNVPVSGGCSRKTNNIRRSKSRKTSAHYLPITVQRKPGDHRESARYTASFGSPATPITQADVDRCLEQVRHVKRYSIICARRTSRLAKAQDMHHPLHVKTGIPTMELDKVKSWMRNDTRSRLERIMNKMFCTKVPPQPEPSIKGNLLTKDINELITANVIQRVSDQMARDIPTIQYLVPFTVVEADESGKSRRRFISWTKDDNERLKEYDPLVPLLHPAKYLHRVEMEVGVKRDLKCGFYQVPVPERARAKFRFRDSQGNLYQMKVMPMGHRCAPEVMHTITSVLAGDPGVCKPEASFAKSNVDIYIDGIRYTASKEEAIGYAKRIDSRCREANGAFKEHGSPPELEYVFNGVNYDHIVHKVSLGPRVLLKLRRDRFNTITYAQLETAVGRLLYASAVLGYVIPRFHFTLKIARRRINMLNRNLHLVDKPVPLPKPTRCILAEWRDEVLKNIPIEPPPHPDVVPHTHRLYTDASSKGWGAVLYLDDGGYRLQVTLGPKNLNMR